MAVAGTRQARLIVAVRLGLLSLGAIVLILPFVYMLPTSFKPNTLVLEIPPQFFPHHPTTANYTDAWTSNQFGRYFLNSVIVAVLTTVAAVLLSAMMAYSFARFRFPGRTFLFGLVLIALMVPTMMMLIPQFLLAKQLLLLNSLWGLVVFYTGGNLALNTFLLRSFFQDIPVELEEAMVVDGAGPWTRYWRLILPLSRPALAVGGDLHLPRELGRVHLGADDHQRPGQVHAADRDLALPGPALDELGARLRRLGDHDRSRHRHLRDLPAAVRRRDRGGGGEGDDAIDTATRSRARSVDGARGAARRGAERSSRAPTSRPTGTPGCATGRSARTRSTSSARRRRRRRSSAGSPRASSRTGR